MKLLYLHGILLVGLAAAMAMPTLQEQEQTIDDSELSTQEQENADVRGWLWGWSKKWKEHKNKTYNKPGGKREDSKIAEESTDLDFEDALIRSWLSKQWNKHKDAIIDGVLSGAASAATIAAIGKREEDISTEDLVVTEYAQDFDIDDAVMRSWLSHQWKKHKNAIIGGVVAGAAKVAWVAAMGKREEDAEVRGWLSKKWKQHKDSIIQGFLAAKNKAKAIMNDALSKAEFGAKLALLPIKILANGGQIGHDGGPFGKREDSKLAEELKEINFKDALIRSWLSKQWKKHKDAIIDGVLSGAASAATIAALGKREEDLSPEDIDDAVMRSWLSHQWKKHKDAIIDGVLSGAATAGTIAAIGKREEDLSPEDIDVTKFAQNFDIEDAVMRSWMSHEWKKHKNSIIGGVISGAAKVAAGAAIGKREEDF